MTDKELNELAIDNDIHGTRNPESVNLPNWEIALLAAGALTAALSTTAGLLLLISSSVSHDLVKKLIKPDIYDKGELWVAKLSAAVAGYFVEKKLV